MREGTPKREAGRWQSPEKGTVRGSVLNSFSVRNATGVVQEHPADGMVSSGETPAVETDAGSLAQLKLGVQPRLPRTGRTGKRKGPGHAFYSSIV